MEIYTVRNVENKIKFACKILHYQAFIYLYPDIRKVSTLVYTFIYPIAIKKICFKKNQIVPGFEPNQNGWRILLSTCII